MTEIPRVVYLEKDTEFNVESEATEVENILKEIDNLKGERLCELTRYKFEYSLERLLNYVTLIGWEITPGYYNLENHRMEEILVYYYNEDMVRILGLQLMADNSFKSGMDITKYQQELHDYKTECLQNNRCVVYNIDDTYGDRVFKLNIRMSNLRQL